MRTSKPVKILGVATRVEAKCFRGKLLCLTLTLVYQIQQIKDEGLTMVHLSSLFLMSRIVKIRFHPSQRTLVVLVARDGAFFLQLWDCSQIIHPLLIVERAVISSPSHSAGTARIKQPDRSRPAFCVIANQDKIAVTLPGLPVQLYCCEDLRLVAEIGHPAQRRDVVSSLDGLRIAYPCLLDVGGKRNRLTEIYNIASESVDGYICHSNSSYAVHPEGQLVAIAVNDQGGSRLRFAALLPTNETFAIVRETNMMIEGLAFSPNGSLLAVNGLDNSDTLELYAFPEVALSYRLTLNQIQRNITDLVGSDRIVFSPDSNSLFFPSADGNVYHIQSDRGSLRDSWTAHQGHVTTMDLSSQQLILATGGVDGWVQFWSPDLRVEQTSVLTGLITATFRQGTKTVPPTNITSSKEIRF
jgi:WD40 repeat protein